MALFALPALPCAEDAPAAPTSLPRCGSWWSGGGLENYTGKLSG